MASVKLVTERNDGFAVLKELFEDTARYVGEEYLSVLVRGLSNLLGAETTFVARALDYPTTRVRGIAAWKDGDKKEAWEYDLEGNPCQLTYDGQPTFIPCNIAESFIKKKDSGYDSYIGVPLFSETGAVIGHIAVYSSNERDVSDFSLDIVKLCAFRAEGELRRVLSEEKLHQELSDLRSKSDFQDEAVMTVAHDLRSPLNAVLGFLSMARTQNLPVEVSSYVHNAFSGAEQLLALINDYLDLERISATETTIAKTEVSLDDLVGEVVEDAKLIGMEQKVRVSLTLSDEIVVMGDKSQLQRALANLISNAIGHSPENETVAVSVYRNDKDAFVKVSDQGPGIPRKAREEVFRPFSRVKTLKHRESGSGIGLAITKAIMNRHGGDVYFECSSGEGSDFFAQLPVQR